MEVTSPRRLTAKQKAEVVLALLRGEDAAGLARSCGVSWAQLFEWRDQFIEVPPCFSTPFMQPGE
jgi:transposase-like protein